MPKNKVRSIRGEVVDFDLLKVKQKIETRDKPDDVEMREKYIDIRRRRNPRRNVSDLLREQNQNMLDAREKIQKSKQNAEEKKKLEADESTGVAEVSEESSEVEVTPTEAPRKKRIVKKKKENDE